MGIVGKEKRVYFDTSGSLSCLWSTAICYGFVPQAIVCFVNRTDVESQNACSQNVDELGQDDVIWTFTLFFGNESKQSRNVVVVRNNVEYNPGIPSQP